MTQTTSAPRSFWARAWNFIKSIFIASTPDDPKSNPGTNATPPVSSDLTTIPEKEGFMDHLLNQLETNFVREMNERSARSTVKYPMMFCIYLHPQDFNKYETTLNCYIDQIAAIFHEVIAKKCKYLVEKKGYDPKDIKYDPMSPNWAFCFSKLDKGENPIEGGGSIRIDNPGEVIVLSSELPPAPANDGNNESGANSMRMSLYLRNSTGNENVDINLGALMSVIDMGGGLKKKKFDPDLNEHIGPEFTRPFVTGSPTSRPSTNQNQTISPAPDTNHNHEQTPANPSPAPAPATAPTAMVEFVVAGRRFQKKIENGSLIVTRLSDSLSDSPTVLKINDSEIENSHINLIYHNGQWLLIAFAPARLNGKKIPLSTKGNKQGVPLTDGAKIVIGETELKFSVI